MEPGSVVKPSFDLEEVGKALFDIEKIANCDVFQVKGMTMAPPRLYGGQTIAQSLLSASLTVPDDTPVHSLHAYFILAGDGSKNILFEVDRVRDGRSFFTRAIKAKQDNKTICHTMCSFHKEEPGHLYDLPLVDFLRRFGMEELPDPEKLIQRNVTQSHKYMVINVANGDDWSVKYMKVNALKNKNKGWRFHATVLACLSDLGMVAAVRRPHEVRRGISEWGMCVSLDHAIHFHKTNLIDVSKWIILVETTKTSSFARGLCTTYCYNLAGELLATFHQEALIRPKKEDIAKL